MSEEMRLDEQALMQQALVGTQRLEAFDPQWPDALLALLRDANEAAPAPKGAHRASVQLLRAAGAAGLLGRAGHLPAACGTAPDLSVAPDDALAAPTDASVIEALSAALREGSADLICQSWNLLARAGLRLPFTLLPAALDAGARSTALREDLLAVLGHAACGSLSRIPRGNMRRARTSRPIPRSSGSKVRSSSAWPCCATSARGVRRQRANASKPRSRSLARRSVWRCSKC
ncbi:hypothetical protein H9K75_09350 [Diaphorobacter aerolatus]|uniref:Uncharacterized protein n=1 Tax=Diaphorobacter aerolatus TaxID=1288495 RepID=A0A7H0GP09_9BURK|nr:hypothetical protein H9K75_09350 [Diaphorobacter aerolatus]